MPSRSSTVKKVKQQQKNRNSVMEENTEKNDGFIPSEIERFARESSSNIAILMAVEGKSQEEALEIVESMIRKAAELGRWSVIVAEEDKSTPYPELFQFWSRGINEFYPTCKDNNPYRAKEALDLFDSIDHYNNQKIKTVNERVFKKIVGFAFENIIDSYIDKIEKLWERLLKINQPRGFHKSYPYGSWLKDLVVSRCGTLKHEVGIVLLRVIRESGLLNEAYHSSAGAITEHIISRMRQTDDSFAISEMEILGPLRSHIDTNRLSQTPRREEVDKITEVCTKKVTAICNFYGMIRDMPEFIENFHPLLKHGKVEIRIDDENLRITEIVVPVNGDLGSIYELDFEGRKKIFIDLAVQLKLGIADYLADKGIDGMTGQGWFLKIAGNMTQKTLPSPPEEKVEELNLKI